MRIIKNKEYIELLIRENLYFYILVDKNLRKEFEINKEELLIRLNLRVEKIYENYLSYKRLNKESLKDFIMELVEESLY